jgi:hypothetical protein
MFPLPPKSSLILRQAKELKGWNFLAFGATEYMKGESSTLPLVSKDQKGKGE